MSNSIKRLAFKICLEKKILNISFTVVGNSRKEYTLLNDFFLSTMGFKYFTVAK